MKIYGKGYNTVGNAGGSDSVSNASQYTMQSFNTGNEQINANKTNKKYALIGVKSREIGNEVIISGVALMTTTNDDFLFEVWKNPTVSDTFTYADEGNLIQAVAGDEGGDNEVTGGELVFSCYVYEKSAAYVNLGLMLTDDGTNADEYVLTAQPVSTNLDVYASINYLEF